MTGFSPSKIIRSASISTSEVTFSFSGSTISRATYEPDSVSPLTNDELAARV
ncbi:MAG: hypothetical protein KIT41_02035 [Pyrinomonadaceae bacterium]|nr:hypothetical protein [Pyrinomonadaceae bacterium]